jgi:predicted membrane protein
LRPAERRRFLALGAGSAIEGQADISTPAKALAFLPQGLVYFWFSPFPWQARSTLQLLSVPEMLLIYALTPAIIRGVGWTVRNRLRRAVQVLLLTSLLTVAYALGSGNVGTLYRHRAQSIVFYMMFAAAGMVIPRTGVSAVEAHPRVLVERS